jgi:hypothetical protein
MTTYELGTSIFLHGNPQARPCQDMGRQMPERRLTVWAAHLAFTALVALTIAQALAGRPTF